jgi:hypothetical protein
MNVPVPTRHLFPSLDQKLLELLRSLKPEEWHTKTRAKLWTVKDIASHLLDGNIRAISMLRDNFLGEKTKGIDSYKQLVDYLNELNAAWINATKNISPRVLIELLELTGKEYTQQMQTLDLFAPSLFPVAWAGEETSVNWFHIAREYTEKWHHQQQIREAVHGDVDTELLSRELYSPVLETFMLALPHAYRNVAPDVDTVIHVGIKGLAGDNWCLFRKHDRWDLTKNCKDNVTTSIIIDQSAAWKLFTKGLSRQDAYAIAIINGNEELAEPLLSMVCVMA